MKISKETSYLLSFIFSFILISFTETTANAQNGSPKALWRTSEGTLELFYVPAGSIISQPIGATLYDITTGVVISYKK